MKTKAEHTPGPWHVGRKVRNQVYARDGLDIIAQCDTMSEATRVTEEANARLIAAAPDLLAAAQLALEAVADPADWNFQARPALVAAIAKARG